MAEIHRADDDPALGQRFVEALGARKVSAVPGPAMEVDDRREWTLALRLVEASDQRLVAVAEIFDIFCGDFISLGRHVAPSRGWSAGSEGRPLLNARGR